VAAPSIPSRRLVVLLVITAVALMTVDVRGFAPLDRAREVTLSATRPPRDLARWAATPVLDTWRGAVHYDDLVAENAALRDRIAELEGAIDRAPDAEAELAELLRATDIGFSGDIPRLTARVTTDRETGLERLVEIDKGSDHGLRAEMPVVTGTGLVGRLELVTPRRSVVRLITQPQFNVGVRSRNGAVGVAQGDGTGQALALELSQSRSVPVRPGQRFETTAFERSVFPPGLPVGRLVGDPDDDEGLRLEPLADLDRLGYLSVLLWEPER
jgi:rod shape-determining protein MreC